jgi:hypothetical protein
MGGVLLQVLQARALSELDQDPTEGYPDMSFNPADYASVDERLPLFWKDCPRGRIITELVVDDGTRIVMKASLFVTYEDYHPTTTGFAEEVRGSSMVNKTSALENCETSAVGRALANYQYQGGKKRASLEEVVKVYRQGGELSASGPTTSTNSDEPSPKQLGLLRSLGWNGDKPQTKREASQLIETLKAQSASEAPF